MFYTTYWSGIFEPYSWLLLSNEMLEQLLFFVDPIVYIGMSTELRKTVMKIVSRDDNSVHPTEALDRAKEEGNKPKDVNPTVKMIRARRS